MLHNSSRAGLIAGSLLCAALAWGQPNSGTQWEMKMNIPGMEDVQLPEGVELPPGMVMPGAGGYSHKVCMSKDTTRPPPAEDDCKILEQRSTGNRHYMKAQCPDGLVEMDQVRTATTLHSDMTITERNGTVNKMSMDGRALGDCDYTAEHRATEAQVASIKKQASDAQRQGDEYLRTTCDQGVKEMQGFIFAKDQACSARKKKFCDRLQTAEGWKLVKKNTAQEMPAGMPAGYARADQLKMCGVTESSLLAKLCPQASRSFDFRFVDENCPAKVADLCDEALKREEYWYIGRHCEAIRGTLIAQHCKGRQYSNQVEPKYKEMCANAMGGDLGASTAVACIDADNDGKDDNDDHDCPRQQPEDKVKQGVKKGIDGLRSIFNR